MENNTSNEKGDTAHVSHEQPPSYDSYGSYSFPPPPPEGGAGAEGQLPPPPPFMPGYPPPPQGMPGYYPPPHMMGYYPPPQAEKPAEVEKLPK